jgi:hypothetical protein
MTLRRETQVRPPGPPGAGRRARGGSADVLRCPARAAPTSASSRPSATAIGPARNASGPLPREPHRCAPHGLTPTRPANSRLPMPRAASCPSCQRAKGNGSRSGGLAAGASGEPSRRRASAISSTSTSRARASPGKGPAAGHLPSVEDRGPDGYGFWATRSDRSATRDSVGRRVKPVALSPPGWANGKGDSSRGPCHPDDTPSLTWRSA